MNADWIEKVTTLGYSAPTLSAVRGESPGDQIAQILSKTEDILIKEKPDKVLLLGDTNSSLSSIIAKRMGITVYHMEAGNRCYDDRVPEEVNRRIIDHSSDILMPYTERSRQNLLREGIASQRIFVTGNPILEVLKKHETEINTSPVFEQLGLQPDHYFLVTMHRAENVDLVDRLRKLSAALNLIQKEFDHLHLSFLALKYNVFHHLNI
ncbi:UDP-N-acetyl glucosamine 2-epimerase [Candidatus Roizmanbacteria bacterium]|nr:UDP-N-acetyl glucosamine 2-epimerase [Candidatus Roizmanbacteria bacterium]